ENVRDAVIATDLAGQITYWNRGAETMFGRPAAEAVGQSVTILNPSGSPDEVERDLERWAAGAEQPRDTWTRRPDGTEVWRSVQPVVVRDERGRPLHLVSVSQDITSRKRIEDELAQIVSAIDQSADAVAVLDVDGRFAF